MIFQISTQRKNAGGTMVKQRIERTKQAAGY
jgi:hypothetical protein